MPVSGEITEINPALVDAPEKLNKDPHGSAWLVKIRLSDPEGSLRPDGRRRLRSLRLDSSQGTLITNTDKEQR